MGDFSAAPEGSVCPKAPCSLEASLANPKGTFTRKGDRVEGRYTMTQDGESMTVVAVGKKLGACDPDKPLGPAKKK
jgi:hypothetical protein